MSKSHEVIFLCPHAKVCKKLPWKGDDILAVLIRHW